MDLIVGQTAATVAADRAESAVKDRARFDDAVGQRRGMRDAHRYWRPLAIGHRHCQGSKRGGFHDHRVTAARPAGRTTAHARQMSGRGHVFTLADEVRTLRGELEHTSGGRAAKTLAKTDGVRVTLVLLSGGTTLTPESTAGGASLHVLEGRRARPGRG